MTADAASIRRSAKVRLSCTRKACEHVRICASDYRVLPPCDQGKLQPIPLQTSLLEPSSLCLSGAPDGTVKVSAGKVHSVHIGVHDA